MNKNRFTELALKIDAASEVNQLCEFIRAAALNRYKRKGAVVGLSGGIDSAVTAECCVRALGRERVIGALLPEKESNPLSHTYGKMHADKMGIEAMTTDISGPLEAFGIYENRNKVIEKYFPGFDDTWQFNITLPQNLLEKNRINFRSITVRAPQGNLHTKRLAWPDWLEISSCQNVKQRIRMIHLYQLAEKRHFVVAGTTNRTEAEQVFFVKYGDGGVDIEPLMHLYKSQIYEVANFLDIPEEIIKRAPSPDTYSLPVTDREFYFCLDYELLDKLLFAFKNSLPPDMVSDRLGLTNEQVERVFSDFRAKEQNTWHLRELPVSKE